MDKFELGKTPEKETLIGCHNMNSDFGVKFPYQMVFKQMPNLTSNILVQKERYMISLSFGNCQNMCLGTHHETNS